MKFLIGYETINIILCSRLASKRLHTYRILQQFSAYPSSQRWTLYLLVGVRHGWIGIFHQIYKPLFGIRFIWKGFFFLISIRSSCTAALFICTTIHNYTIFLRFYYCVCQCICASNRCTSISAKFTFLNYFPGKQ